MGKIRRKDKKELDVLRAVKPHKGCWVSSRFVKNSIDFRTKISGTISIGKLLSRIGFEKRNKHSTAPGEFFIDDKTFNKRMKKIKQKI